jgi:hypothetical protein
MGGEGSEGEEREDAAFAAAAAGDLAASIVVDGCQRAPSLPPPTQISRIYLFAR